MGDVGSEAGQRSEARDYYAILDAEPSASSSELRTAFRTAVLRYHPDRTGSDALATRRTSVLNRVWAVLRDPVERVHYDRALEAGRAPDIEWPLDPGEVASRRPRRPRRIVREPERSPWHQPQWRNVAGFRVPTAIWLQGPAAQQRYIVEHYIAGQEWRDHRELYWLRYAAEHYRARGRTEDWLGALERLTELDPTFDTLVRAHLRTAYVESQANLRGASFLHRLGARYERGSRQREWVDREIRLVLGPFRDRVVRGGAVASRGENAELLLNYLEALELEPTLADYQASIRAHQRTGNVARAMQLVERVAAWNEVEHPSHWFAVVDILIAAGALDRASALLASIARGERPETLDAARFSSRQLERRLSTARARLAAARQRDSARPAARTTGRRRTGTREVA
ncbi:MAG: J domain-containing protein [Candidatus Limnocylindria bacterium]